MKGEAKRVQKFHVYLMRRGDRHYEDIGDRIVTVSDDRRDAWVDVDGTELHATVKREPGRDARSGRVRDIYLIWMSNRRGAR
jgi:hypothetical protein